MKAKTASDILKMHNLTPDEMHEYKRLKELIYGRDEYASLFVVLDFKNPDHVRLNELSGKMQRLYAFLLAHRGEHWNSHLGLAVSKVVTEYIA